MTDPTTVVVQTPSAYTGFNEDHPQYHCCTCVHVKTGAIIIGVLEILWSLTNIGGLLAQHEQKNYAGLDGSIYYGLGGSTIAILVAVLLFVGAVRESHIWVIPHLVVQVMGIIALFIGGIAAIVVAATGMKETADIWGLLIFTAAILVLFAAFEIWWFKVILQFYRYCKHKKRYSSSMGNVIEYGNQQPVVSHCHQFSNPNYAKFP